MNLLHIENNELRLNTNLNEYTFGKTAHDAVLNQEGVLFDGKNFRQWTFEEVKSYNAPKNGITEALVFYCMKDPFGTDSKEAKTLAEFLEQGGTSALNATLAVCAALTAAAKNGNTIPLVGAGGIMVAGDKVLFVPESLFTFATNTLSAADSLNLHRGFLNNTLSGLPAICFERAALIYRLLANTLPFTQTDEIARNADILDQNFLPLELCVDGLDQDFTKAVNNALKLNSNIVAVPGKRVKGKTSEELRPEPDFPLEKLKKAFELSQSQAENGTTKEFEEKVAAYKKSHNSRLKTKRGFRRNATTIGVIAAIALVIVIVSINSIKSRATDYTSIGLTSTQTIRAYMNAVNEKDTAILTDFGSGKTPGNFGDMVSRVFVMHKQRQAYGDNGFAYPSNWLFYITDEARYARSGIYGITNLKIDGKPESLKIELKKRNEKPAPLTKEGNITLENGLTSVHNIEYYLIYTEGEETDFLTDKVNAVITLTFKKNRWVITDIQLESRNLNTDCIQFKADYFAELKKTDGEVIPAVDALRSKYEWLPEPDAMQREKDRIDYELAHPYSILGF